MAKSSIQTIRGLGRKVLELLPTNMRSKARDIGYNVFSFYYHGRKDMFSEIAIETTSICNRACSFCPNGKEELKSKRPKKHMSMEVYKKIIDQLAQRKYRGSVSLQHYGEPLLDTSLEGRIAYARERLPNAHIELNSNGDYLTPEKLQGLIKAGINQVHVTDYEEGEATPTLQSLFGYLDSHPEHREYVTFRKGLKSLQNRGGLIEIAEKDQRKASTCINETRSINVDVDGNVVLCSNDYLGQVKLGHVEQSSVYEIWDHPDYKTRRKNLRKGIFVDDICKKCTYQ